jgi:hypothetical protein
MILNNIYSFIGKGIRIIYTYIPYPERPITVTPGKSVVVSNNELGPIVLQHNRTNITITRQGKTYNIATNSTDKVTVSTNGSSIVINTTKNRFVLTSAISGIEILSTRPQTNVATNTNNGIITKQKPPYVVLTSNNKT